MSSTVELVSHGLLARVDVVATATAAMPPELLGGEAPLALALSGFESVREIARRPVRIAILGECNSGKTTLANRLIGSDVLPTSVVSNTPYDVWVRHDLTPSVHASGADGARFDCTRDASMRPDHIRGLEIGLPFQVLRDIEIIDTCARRLVEGESSAPSTLPKADVLVWCTNAARAWGASERAARTACPPMPRARAVLVATHADTLRGQDARRAVLERLRQEAGRWFGTVLFTGLGDSEAEGQGVSDDAASGEDARLDFETLILRTANQYRTRRERTLTRLAGRLARLALEAIETKPATTAINDLRSALEPLAPSSAATTQLAPSLRKQRLSPAQMAAARAD